MTFDPATTRRTLFRALVDAARRHGRQRPVLEDAERQPMSYGRLLLGATMIGRKLAAQTARGEAVGVLLPSAAAAAVTIFGLSAHGRVPAMLNFTAGVKNLNAAAVLAGLRCVVTSRRFVDTAKLDDVVDALAAADGPALRVLFLEDVRADITAFDKIVGVAAARLAGLLHDRRKIGPDEPGIILFTSGSEGSPKGVVLSHANLLANAGQIWAHAEGALSTADVMFNPLPVFHSFGLTAGLLTGVLNGMKVVLYPSPLHYRQAPKLIGETRATVLVSTDTFLQGYARAADAADLASIKFVVAGAERVRDETRRMWDRHGATITEGYGATECAPVICCNRPDANRPGTVGRFLPAIDHRLEPVAGIAEGGRLAVKGLNVMAGYLRPGGPGALDPPPDGWYDTGDIVKVDGDEFVTILGRARRFAKIGGEMVSLAAVESMVSALWPGATHVVVALPDARKGEQLVLVTDQADADRAALAAHARDQGYPELWTPRALLVVASIPVLGSGKTDVAATTEMARTMRPML